MLTVSQAPVHRAFSRAEALALRAAHPEAMPLAGGTDVLVYLEGGVIDPPAFLDLWAARDLAGVEADDGGLWIGALTTHTELIEDARVRDAAPALVEACRTVGARQIQNRGTLGGNIANASPAGDTLPVLMALDAEVEVASAARGARLIAMADLYLAYRRLAVAPDELITRVFVPAPHPADVTHFRKVGTRLAQAISKVIVGARVRIEGGIVTEARVALGSVAPVPVRARAVEAALIGRAPSPEAAAHVGADIVPIDDVRSTAAYRLAVTENTLRASSRRSPGADRQSAVRRARAAWSSNGSM